MLHVVVAILKAAGFHVLQADGGVEALRVAAEYPDRIDLLLSDLKMPEMSGPELGELLKKTRPRVRVMLMSGFSGDLLVLNYGSAFIESRFCQRSWSRWLRTSSIHPTNHRAVTNSISVKTTRQNSGRCF